MKSHFLPFKKIVLVCSCFCVFIVECVYPQSIDTLNNLSDTLVTPIDTSDYITGDIDFNLIIAADRGDDKEVLRLLNKGAYIDIRTSEGVTPLMYAVQNKHEQVVKILLLNGANPNLYDYNGTPSLIAAIRNNDLNISEMLIRYDADVDIKDEEGMTPLMYAVASGYLQIVDMLIYYDAQVNMTDDKGTTALMIASYFGFKDIANLLIENGATLEKTDHNGFTSLHIATQNNNEEIIELLVSQGVDIEKKNNAGYSSLSIAVLTNNKVITDYYIENGADVNSKISIAYLPLNLAKKNKNDTIYQVLEENNARLAYYPSIGYASINFDFSASAQDFLMGGGIGFHDTRYGMSMNVGYVTRLFATEVLKTVDESLYYQYWERRSYFYLSLTERIPVYSWKKDHWFGFGAGGQLLYTYGSYRGTDEKPDNRFLFSPQALAYLRLKHFAMSFKYEYVNFKIEGVSPHRFIIGIHFLIPGKKTKATTHKEILFR
ncbi:hypothetical protein ES705_09143 [subsurface metagenome]